jgi:hypothetical protein
MVIQGDATQLGPFGHLESVFTGKMSVRSPRKHNGADEFVIRVGRFECAAVSI